MTTILDIPPKYKTYFPKNQYSLDEVITTWQTIHPLEAEWISLPVNMNAKDFRLELSNLIDV